MGVYPHIAVCVEDSEGSRRALEEARRLRGLSPGRLSVVHVVGVPAPPPYVSEGGSWLPDPQEMMSGAHRWLAELAAPVPAAEPVVLEGHPAQAACAWAATTGVDLLVAGVERSRFERLLVGSFAGHIIRHSPCDVMLVRSAGRR